MLKGEQLGVLMTGGVIQERDRAEAVSVGMSEDQGCQSERDGSLARGDGDHCMLQGIQSFACDCGGCGWEEGGGVGRSP